MNARQAMATQDLEAVRREIRELRKSVSEFEKEDESVATAPDASKGKSADQALAAKAKLEAAKAQVCCVRLVRLSLPQIHPRPPFLSPRRFKRERDTDSSLTVQTHHCPRTSTLVLLCDALFAPLLPSFVSTPPPAT